MTDIVIPLPIRGFNEGINVEDTPPDTTNDIMNVRPVDSLSQRIRLGKRPGFVKAYSTQIAGSPGAIVDICSVTIVDYLGV